MRHMRAMQTQTGGRHVRAPSRSSTSSCTRASSPSARALYARAARLALNDDLDARRVLRRARHRDTTSAAASSSATPSARSGFPTWRCTTSPRRRRGRGGLGVTGLLAPREGPAGWRSVVATPAGRRARTVAVEGGVVNDLLAVRPGRRRSGVRIVGGGASRLSCTLTATACSARCTTPTTRPRTRCCAAWRGLDSYEGQALVPPLVPPASPPMPVSRRPALPRPCSRSLRTAPPPDDGLGEPILESLWIEPIPPTPGRRSRARYEQRESVELAFVAALQHLPSRQRAALLLSDVLGFPPPMWPTCSRPRPAAVNSALQRAPGPRAAIPRADPADDAA